uniref:Trichocyst matrix protein T4-B n=1 Tax=Philasterides dicentrarchi TaxID=282688 RepID=A0A2Z4NAG8_9CILI|nr:trichocyst matrix protein T4-B [Philasterides dicentrarchi]QEE82884.1 trichocyst matrix protein T4-B [Philasterides dicentrarchi]
MKRVAIILLLTVLSQCGIQRSPARLSDTKTVLAEMDKDSFGSTILSAVALNAATGNPVEEITVLIEEIVEQLTTEQNQADGLNTQNEASCETNIDNLNQQIAQTKATIESTENALKINSEILKDAKVTLAQANRDFDEVVESIDQGSQQRRADHERWVEEDYANAISIATLEEGVKLINHMIHGVEFTQIKSRYEKVLDKLKEDNNKHASLFKPLISSLTQLATRLNYENVMKILELLNNIRLTIAEEQQQAKEAENIASEDWQKLLNHLAAEKQRLGDKKARLSSLIEATTTLLEQYRQSLENNKVQLENYSQTLVNETQRCSQQAETYAVESAERARELEILERLLEHMREKYNQVSEYVSSRVYSDF